MAAGFVEKVRQEYGRVNHSAAAAGGPDGKPLDAGRTRVRGLFDGKGKFEEDFSSEGEISP